MRYAFRGVVLVIGLMALAGCSALNPGTAKAEKTAEAFHAVGVFGRFVLAVLAVYLRQRGSPESKPVGEPHSSTGVQG